MSWGENFLKDFAGGFFGSEYLRDYAHASKTFRTNSYQYAPKLKFLFHTYFDINREVFDFDEDASSGQNFGILVKDIKLPSYTFNTTQLNQYNRKRIVQTKIKYDPVQITFHDDNSSLITKMWVGYYTYYYGDGSIPGVMFSGNRGPESGNDPTSVLQADTFRNLAGVGSGFTGGSQTDADYNSRNIYDPSLNNNNWGYAGDAYARRGENAGTTKMPFFKNITIFGFNQHQFIAYTLVNPIITNFAHDTYNYDEGNGTMKNTMTIDYETVVYNEGAMDGREPGNIVTGFGDKATYDRTLSPIAKAGSNGTILGKGGLIDSVGGAVSGLKSGNGKDLLASIQTIGTTYNTFKNLDLKSVAKAEFNSMLNNALQDNPDKTRNVQFTFPGAAASPSNTGTAGAPTTGAIENPGAIERFTNSIGNNIDQFTTGIGLGNTGVGQVVRTVGKQISKPVQQFGNQISGGDGG